MGISRNITLPGYISVADEGGVSFGGNQNWFSPDESSSRNLRRGACGLIGAEDFCLYYEKTQKKDPAALQKRSGPSSDAPLDKDNYLSMIRREARSAYPIFPGVGSFNFEFELFVNRKLKKAGSDDRIRYLFLSSSNRRRSLIRKQLEAGCPVPLIIGQHLLSPLSKKGITFYTFKNGKPVPVYQDVYRHFVNITGIRIPEDMQLPLYYEISSWGRKYYIDAVELEKYASKISAPWITSVFILDSIRKDG